MKNTGEKIYECEVRRQHQINGERIWKWIRRLASAVDRSDRVRCYECRGKVRLHKQKNPNGPRDHVEHVSRQDSEGCPLGHYYVGTFKISSDPVE